MRFRALLSVVLLLLPFSLFAQSHRDSVTVEVIDVPVYVQRGLTPITGLTKDDFELFVNGKRQPIEYFDVVGDDAEDSMRERRLFLLVFDLAFSRPGVIQRAQKAASKLVERAAPGDTFAIATFTSTRGLQFTVPFTTDTVALQRAIRGFSAEKADDPLRLVVNAGERADWMSAAPPQTGEGDPMYDLALVSVRPAVEMQLEDLGNVAVRLSQLEGQKHIVMLSEGFNPTTFRDPLQSKSALASFTAGYANQLYENMHRRFKAAGVFLHTLDIGGLRVVADRPGIGTLHRLASETGGAIVNNRNDFDEALGDIATAYGRGYLLGFRPTNVKSGYNRISVKAKSRGYVAHRQGFYGSAPGIDTNDGIYLADILLNDVPQTGIAAAIESTGNGDVSVRVPLRQVAALLGDAGSADLLLYIFDANGLAVASRRVTIEVAAGATEEKTIVVALGLPPGTYTAKALLRVGESIGLSIAKVSS